MGDRSCGGRPGLQDTRRWPGRPEERVGWSTVVPGTGGCDSLEMYEAPTAWPSVLLCRRPKQLRPDWHFDGPWSARRSPGLPPGRQVRRPGVLAERQVGRLPGPFSLSSVADVRRPVKPLSSAPIPACSLTALPLPSRLPSPQPSPTKRGVAYHGAPRLRGIPTAPRLLPGSPRPLPSGLPASAGEGEAQAPCGSGVSVGGSLASSSGRRADGGGGTR